MLIVPVHHHRKELPPTIMMTCDVASCFARPSRSSTKPDDFVLFSCFQSQQQLCIHHHSIESSIALLHLQVPFYRVPSTTNPNPLKASRTTKIPLADHTFHQNNHLGSIMQFITALFSLFAATATAFPTKPGYSTQPAARDAGDVSLTFSFMSQH